MGRVVGGVAGFEVRGREGSKGVNPEEMRVDTPASGPDHRPSNDVCSPISLIRLI